MKNIAEKKSSGAYYTCHSIADYIADWAIEAPDTCVLEPSFGDGIFLDSAIRRYAALGNANPEIMGVEIQEQPFDLYMRNHTGVLGFCMDFMDFRAASRIHAIIGNPPYIRLKNLAGDEREKVLQLVSSYGLDMQTSGSLWMPFIIHATELLEDKGKLGFVLPYEITYVRYAFDLWRYLSLHYGKITICRIYHDFFPDVDVETILFLAENKGEQTEVVSYKVFETIMDLYADNACLTSQIRIEDILRMRKPFVRALMPQSVVAFLDSLRKDRKLQYFARDCKFNIGYVTGKNSYFHLSEEEAKQHGIRSENLIKCLRNAKQITSNANHGIETGSIPNYSYLFYPIIMDQGALEYISDGEKQGVHKGYKCRKRMPWYMTPGIEIPDVILTVFGDIPKMLLNNGLFCVSNSLLSGFSRVENPKELICRWYNSLTLLSVEMTVHSLGGGTFVLIPGETDLLELISGFPAEKIEETYAKISAFSCNHTTAEIYQFGDSVVLQEIYGFSDEEIRDIRSALQTLRNWRNPEKRRG